MNIYIQDKYMKSDDFSPDMIITYLALRKLILKDVNEYYISLGLLTYTLLGKQVASQLITNSFITGLNNLIKKQYIIHVDKDLKGRSNEYILNLSMLQIKKYDNSCKEYYTPLDYNHITTILSNDFKEKISLLCFYCYLMTTVMKSGEKMGVGFTSYEEMSNDIGITRQTISKYMNKLENLKVIYIYRSADAVMLQQNIIREIPNVYGDISIKEKVINVAKVYEENYGINAKRIKSTKSSSTRSASAKFAILEKEIKETGEIRYNYDSLKEIYETLKDYNERYKLIEGDDKYKDLSIFSGYDFYEKKGVNT